MCWSPEDRFVRASTRAPWKDPFRLADDPRGGGGLEDLTRERDPIARATSCEADPSARVLVEREAWVPVLVKRAVCLDLAVPPDSVMVDPEFVEELLG
jgi:hypothetical protein